MTIKTHIFTTIKTAIVMTIKTIVISHDHSLNSRDYSLNSHDYSLYSLCPVYFSDQRDLQHQEPTCVLF